MKFNKRLRLLTLGSIAAITIASYFPLSQQYKIIAPYLEADRKSEESRQPGGGKDVGGLDRLVEDLKTKRDFFLFARNNLSDNKPEYNLFVYKDTNTMDIYDASGTLVKQMRVGSGKIQQDEKTSFGQFVTPIGDYLLINTFDKSGLEDKFGQKAHNYGDGMLQLSGPWAPYIAIHGTDNPSKIGAYHSNGCVNVSNVDIVWLLDNVGVGSRVYILRQK